MTGSWAYSDTRFNFSWSSWTSLDLSNQELDELPSSPGLYAIRHRDREGLEYIGETEDLRRRVRTLAGQIHKEKMPFRDPHTAASCLWAVRDLKGPGLEVSCTTPESATEDQQRKGLEAVLIAGYRQSQGRSPTANFGRMIPGYKQSTSRAGGIRGERLDNAEERAEVTPSRSPPSGTNRTDVTGMDWMGLSWSAPRPLEDRLQVDLKGPGIYRIWYKGSAPPLAYLGESANLKARFYHHEKTFGEHALVAITAPPDIETRAKREEIETDLIGAHVLQHETPPLAQFGSTERVPPRGYES